MTGSARGIDRERKLVAQLTADGWFAMRAPASLGPVDVVALKEGERPLVCEVKSTHKGPFHSFGPADREGLSYIARVAGADAYLVYWPPRSEPKWIPESAWPGRAAEAAA